MNYSEMSDVEINISVAQLIFPNKKVIGSASRPPKAHIVGDGLRAGSWVDYCNSWSDAGPVIEKHMICLAADVFAEPQDGGKWVARPAYGWDKEAVRNDNPLRAAMILFLQSRENPNE